MRINHASRLCERRTWLRVRIVLAMRYLYLCFEHIAQCAFGARARARLAKTDVIQRYAIVAPFCK